MLPAHSRSRDIIGHVTIRFAICHFLLVVHWNQGSTSPAIFNIFGPTNVNERTYSVSQKIPPPQNFLTFFPQRLGTFSRNFTHLLYVPIYAGLQIFI